MATAKKERKKPVRREAAERRRTYSELALRHLTGALIGRCLVHPECASASSFDPTVVDLGRACMQNQMTSLWTMKTSDADEQRWLWGHRCEVCARRAVEYRKRLAVLDDIQKRGLSWTEWEYAMWPNLSMGFTPYSFVMTAFAPLAGESHHHCPRSMKQHEAPIAWQDALFGGMPRAELRERSKKVPELNALEDTREARPGMPGAGCLDMSGGHLYLFSHPRSRVP